MLISETVVLTEQERKAPPVTVRVRRTGGFYELCGSLLPEKVFFADAEQGVRECEGKSPVRIPTSIGECFAIAFFSGELFYFGIVGNGVISRENVKKSIEDFLRSDVKNTYDDYAIATENYYPSSPLIHATFNGIMCEKGHFLKNNGGLCGQHSTNYPQCEDNDDADKNNKKPSFSSDNSHAEKKQGHGQKEKNNESYTGTSARCNSDGDTPFYQRIKDTLDSIFTRFPRVKELERALDGSTFVRINYSEGKHYVVGLTIYDDTPEYVIFGIPLSNPSPPPEFSEEGYFVPLKNGGYYLLYQDALTGNQLFPDCSPHSSS